MREKEDIHTPDALGNFPIFAAQDSPKKMRVLICRGADPTVSNRNGATVLMHAATVGCREVVEILLADPHVNNPAHLDLCHFYGFSAERCARLWGHTEIAERLVRARKEFE